MPETNPQKSTQNYGSLGNANAVKSEQDSPFYNVMPKTEIKGPLIGPKLQSPASAEPEAHAPNFVMKFIELHKIVVIALILLLILAYPAYYLFDKYVLKTNDEQNLLSEEAKNTLKNGVGGKDALPEKLEFKTPKDWQKRFFGKEICRDLKQCGDEADPDSDGLNNLDEHGRETDPNNPDSDKDGLSDGDEIFIFMTLPGSANTANDPDYNDAEYIKGGYNPLKKGEKFSQAEIDELGKKMIAEGLNEPTASTLKDSLISLYKFSTYKQTEPAATSTPISVEDELQGFELTAEAKQDRDTQRSNTIKNMAIALVKYFEAKSAYPDTSDFKTMFEDIKIYTRVATNPTDPVNKGKYIYTYALATDKTDFTLTFFSESQNQLIKTKSANAREYRDQEQGAIYDDQRKTNLQALRIALLLYSGNNAAGNQDYVFPKQNDYPAILLPELITEIPKDPKTDEAYEYQVSENFDSFTLKAVLDYAPTGKSGYICNQEECRYY